MEHKKATIQKFKQIQVLDNVIAADSGAYGIDQDLAIGAGFYSLMVLIGPTS
jgi:hypothetical protein